MSEKHNGVNGPLWSQFRKLSDAVEWGYADVTMIEGVADGSDSTVTISLQVDGSRYAALRADIDKHSRMAQKIRWEKGIDWLEFKAIRDRLYRENEIVRAIVSMNEAGIRAEIHDNLESNEPANQSRT